MKTIILTFIFLLQINAIFATNYYVDGSISKSGNGSINNPFKTIEESINQAGAGDTIFIFGGIYYESYLEPAGGSTNNWLVITNMPGNEVILDGGGPSEENYSGFYIHQPLQSYIEISGLKIRNYYDIGVDLRDCGKITIKNCELYNNGSAGIALNYPNAQTRIIVEDCIAHHNGWGIGWASGIHLNNKGTPTNEPHIIRRNICYNNYDGSDYHTDGNGIMFDVGGGGSCIIENNICFNNGGSGINVLNGNAIIVNNTLFRNAWDPQQSAQQGYSHEIYLGEDIDGQVTEIILQNNIIYSRHNVPILVVDIIGNIEDHIIFDHNLLWNDDGQSGIILPSELNQFINGNPLFVSTVNDNTTTTLYGAPFLNMNYNDYNLYLQGNSPAIDAGIANNAPNHDINRQTRPFGNAVDIGAYEYTSTNSIFENNSLSDFYIYPNPAKNSIYIENNNSQFKNIKIEIYTITGKLIKSNIVLSNNHIIDVSELQNGIYLMKLYDDDKFHIHILIKN